VLLNKLSACVLSLQLLKSLVPYLTQRKQHVRYDQSESFPYIVDSGVPLGSKLGPLFFVLYVNDLPNTATHLRRVLYSDDARFAKKSTIGKMLRHFRRI
jgi:hypothetical protein